MFSFGQSINGKCHGRSSRAGSAVAAVMLSSDILPELVQALTGFGVENVNVSGV
jgi:hypothetical protein